MKLQLLHNMPRIDGTWQEYVVVDEDVLVSLQWPQSACLAMCLTSELRGCHELCVMDTFRAQPLQLCMFLRQMGVPDQLDDYAASQFLVRGLHSYVAPAPCSAPCMGAGCGRLTLSAKQPCTECAPHIYLWCLQVNPCTVHCVSMIQRYPAGHVFSASCPCQCTAAM